MDARDAVSVVVTSSSVTFATYPFHMVKTLVQVGHEPLASYEGRSFPYFGRPARRWYPSALSYVGHIRKQDGLLGLYRGLMPKLLENAVGCLVSDYMLHRIRPQRKREDVDIRNGAMSDYVVFKAKEGVERLVARSFGVIASHPFYVMCLRAIVQFVGRETMYDGILSAIREIWLQEGVKGFFSGLFPRIVYETSAFCISFAVSSLIEFLLAKYGGDEAEKETESQLTDIQVHFFANYVGTWIAYPFQLVAALMAVNNCGLQATQPPALPVFTSAGNCWSYLRANLMMRRGGSIIIRSAS